MNVAEIVSELEEKYPGKNIVLNKDKEGVVVEIICEVIRDSDFSWAIGVIDHSPAHFHKKLVETYKVTKGELLVTLDGKEHRIKEGGFVTIQPNTVHSNDGNETWDRRDQPPRLDIRGPYSCLISP